MIKVVFIALLLFLAVFENAQAALGADTSEYPADNDASYKLNTKNSQASDDTAPELDLVKTLTVFNSDVANCRDSSVQLASCVPSICYEDLSFGKLYRKVKGFDKDGRCKYIERTIGIGGTNCLFSQKELEEAGDLLDKFYGKLFTYKIIISPEESNRLSSLLDSSCHQVKDYKYASTLEINSSSSGMLDPEFIISEGEVTPAPQVTKQSPSDASPQDAAKPKEDVVTAATAIAGAVQMVVPKLTANSPSVMFTKEEIDSILEIVQNFSIEDKSETHSLIGKDRRNNIYLSSLIYYNKNEWTFWLNGTKHTSVNSIPESLVEEVTKNSVKFNITIKNLDKIIPGWKNKMVALDENSYASSNRNIIISSINQDGGTTLDLIRFELKPNQSFDLSTMSITEGKT